MKSSSSPFAVKTKSKDICCENNKENKRPEEDSPVSSGYETSSPTSRSKSPPEMVDVAASVKGGLLDLTPSLMDQPSAIKVAVRLRPLSDAEKAKQTDKLDNIIMMKDNNVILPHKKECFEFDLCLNSTNMDLFNFASQEQVYRKIGEPLLNSCLQGYNVSLFAYGQSGSGKSKLFLMINSLLTCFVLSR